MQAQLSLVPGRATALWLLQASDKAVWGYAILSNDTRDLEDLRWDKLKSQLFALI